MKVISKSLKNRKNHLKKKAKKRRYFRYNLAEQLATTLTLDEIQLLLGKMAGNCFWNNYYSTFHWRNSYLNFWNASKELLPFTSFAERKNLNERTKKEQIEHDSCMNDMQECIRDLNCITLDSNGDSTSSLSENVTDPFKDDCSENSDNFEVSEEMVQFMEINMRHRADLEAEKKKLRKLREELENDETKINDRDDIEECKIPTEAFVTKCRNEEMNNLYGKSAPMIHGMETAIQLTFNWNCDHHKPQYWPILPFTMKFA